MHYVKRWRARLDYHLDYTEAADGPFVYYKDVEPILKEVEILRLEAKERGEVCEVAHANGWSKAGFLPLAQFLGGQLARLPLVEAENQRLAAERDAALARVKELESHRAELAVWTISERYATAAGLQPGASLGAWLEGRLKRLEEPGRTQLQDLLQLARDFGYQGEDGVGLWAWFRDRLQERAHYRYRLDRLAEAVREP